MRLRLFIVMALIAVSVAAQENKGYVHLKNGTVLKGKYHYSDNMEKLMVRSAGNLWVFNASEVEKVTGKFREVESSFRPDTIDSPVFVRTEIGFLVGNSDNSQSAPFSLTGSVNYTVTPKLSAGAGMGIEFLKESYLPVFVNLEYRMRNTQSTPFFFVKAGYQVAIESSRTMNYYDIMPPWSSSIYYPIYDEKMEALGGMLVNPGVGYQRMFSPTFGLSFAFGYQFHRLNYDGEEDYKLKLDYNRLTVKLGILFK